MNDFLAILQLLSALSGQPQGMPAQVPQQYSSAQFQSAATQAEALYAENLRLRQENARLTLTCGASRSVRQDLSGMQPMPGYSYVIQPGQTIITGPDGSRIVRQGFRQW